MTAQVRAEGRTAFLEAARGEIGDDLALAILCGAHALLYGEDAELDDEERMDAAWALGMKCWTAIRAHLLEHGEDTWVHPHAPWPDGMGRIWSAWCGLGIGKMIDMARKAGVDGDYTIIGDLGDGMLEFEYPTFLPLEKE